jgi:hypothetical protein
MSVEFIEPERPSPAVHLFYEALRSIGSSIYGVEFNNPCIPFYADFMPNHRNAIPK